MKLFELICVGLLLLPAASLWAQVGDTVAQPAPADVIPDNGDSRMLTPPPVSGQAYPGLPTAEERPNYLHGGMSFTSAYTDNALGSLGGGPVSDVSYSVAPFISLDETTSRLHWVMNYAPGFTVYQRENGRNETDQNASINLQYRLSPHLTVTAQDGFQKSSNVFNQPDLASAAAVSGGVLQPNFSVVAPVADRLSNTGNAGITYQFVANGAVGASGTFTNLHYPDQGEVPGLFDSNSQAGSVFYSLRISKKHYLGATYQYQRLITDLAGGEAETQTQAILFFYTLYASDRFSISAFGGPQYSNTYQPPAALLQPPLPAQRAWNPAAGASLSWQGRLTSVALSYAHIISGGGGLIGAVHMDSASASLRREIRRNVTAAVAGAYAQNDVLDAALQQGNNGHTVSGTASLRWQFAQRINAELGYTRLRQDYSGVAVLAGTPNTNREFVSIAYVFSRPLGR